MAQFDPDAEPHQDARPESDIETRGLDEKAMRADFERVVRLREAMSFVRDNTQIRQLSVRAAQIENYWNQGSFAGDWDDLEDAYRQYTWTPQSNYRYHGQPLDEYMTSVQRRSQSQAAALASALYVERRQQRLPLSDADLKTELAQAVLTEKLRSAEPATAARVRADNAVGSADRSGWMNAAGLDASRHGDIRLGMDTDPAIGEIAIEEGPRP